MICELFRPARKKIGALKEKNDLTVANS